MQKMGALVCSGEVMHARCRTQAGEHANPARNGFAYPLFFVAVPLSRWGEDVTRSAWLGYDRRAALALHARDHGPRDGSPLLPWVRDMLAREGVRVCVCVCMCMQRVTNKSTYTSRERYKALILACGFLYAENESLKKWNE